MINNIKGRRVLVTGAGGFIGSRLAVKLVEEGADVTAMVRYNSASDVGNLKFVNEEIRSKIKISFGNVEDSNYVQSQVKDQEIIFHLAALIAIPYSYVAPLSYVRTNVEGTLNVLESARYYSVDRVVHTSTSEVYGTALTVPIAEGHPLQGQSPYSASKISADKIVESYYKSFDLPVVTVRPFNTYGPTQSARAFIPTIISQAIKQDHIKLGSLDPVRDMTFVSDTVNGFMAAAQVTKIEGETINLGTGSAYTIGEFAEKILKLMGSDKNIITDKARIRPNKSEVGRLISDNSKALELLDWQPHTHLEDGLLETIEFIKKNINLYHTEKYTV